MGLFGGGVDPSQIARMLENQRRIEQKLDALLAAFAIEGAPEPLPETGVGLEPATREAIEAALRAGNKINAIKLFRDATGLGLAESKQAIEEGRF